MAFCEEERLSRVKHAECSGPRLAVAHCLDRAGATFADVDLVAVGWDVPQASRLYGVDWHSRTRPGG